MRNRHQAALRFTFISALITSLTIIPMTVALAERPTTMVDGGASGVSLSERAKDDSAGKRSLYARGNYVWPYTTGPAYGNVDPARGRAPGVLQTSVGWFDLAIGDVGLPDELKTTNRLTQIPAQYFIVQLEPAAAASGSRSDLEAILAAEGGAIMRSMPVGAVLARLTAGAHSRLQGLTGLIAVEPYHPGFKLDPKIGRAPLPNPIKAMSQVYNLRVRLFAGEPVEMVADTLSKLGGNVISLFPDEVRVEIDRSQLAAIAAMEPVYMIWEETPRMTHAEETTTCMQAGRWNQGATPYHDAGITGGGGGIAATQMLMVLDSGIQMDAAELSHTRTSAGDGVGDPWGSTHRKVEYYGTTIPFGGSGDDLGCDGQQDAYTHGHFVAATALGNATNVDPSYGAGWQAENPTVPGQFWNLDGVAPGARLVAYDAGVTPEEEPCADPETGEAVFPGDLYSAPGSGSLADAYDNYGARTFNFSWGSNTNSYDADANDVDDFLSDHPDAMVFTSAGNAGLDEEPEDGVPDAGSLGTPATFKNGLAIGASRNANDPGSGPNQRAYSSSVGPVDTSLRIAPQLMAPGDEVGDGGLGLASEFACTTNDNDQDGTVSCNVLTGIEGTSFASPAAAGAALLVRDYFAQGFYPDGTSANPGNAGDQHATISGALLKSVLIASAEFMTGGWTYRPWRFNVEQGYGRIELDNVLPLENWPASPSGLIVVDGQQGFGDLSGLDGSINALVGGIDSEEFEVCDDEQTLRIALSWIEESGNVLVNNLDLEIESPSGKIYYGNYFTDDDNRDFSTDLFSEDCPSIDGDSDALEDWGRWSLPVCVRNNTTLSPHDSLNPTEAVFLSMDANGDGWLLGEEGHLDLDPEDDNQIEIGTWKIRVVAPGGDAESDLRYSVALAGGVCIGSSVRLDAGSYVCNSRVKITVNEFDEPSDLGTNLTVGEVAGRLTVQVVDGTGSDSCVATVCSVGGGSCIDDGDCNVVDSESGSDLGLSQPDPASYRYVAEDVVMTDGTVYDAGNGVLDVRSGDTLRVVYADEDSGIANPDKRRVTSADIDCDARIGFGNIVFGQFGMDTTYFIGGGCERNARGNFEFGYPDKYMDEDELISYNFAFASEEDFDLEQAEVSLRCVDVDSDSPEDCRPNSSDCADPNRENNSSCDDGVYMTILDSPKTIGLIPAGAALSANFSVVMASSIPGTPEIEMLLEVTSPTSGKTTSGLAVNRHTLDSDEVSLFFSTDWPTGGTTYRDRNNDEVIEGFLGLYPVPSDVSSLEPTTNYGDFLSDYRFECVNWGDLTAGGTKNMTLQSPWNFDVTDGGFRSGVGADTDLSTISDVIALWGEDKNFNGLNDGYCQENEDVWCEGTDDCNDAGLSPTTCISLEDRDSVNGALDQNWSTLGGCGWQTIPPNACSNNPRRGCYSDTDCVSPGICNRPYGGKGGIWHTGRIGNTTFTNCMVLGDDIGQCQAYETVSGTTGQKMWFELLVTPEISKVNGADHTVELMDWGWNQAIDLADWNSYWSWEVDTDTAEIEPASLTADTVMLNTGNGPYGAVVNQNNPDLTNGFTVFAPVGGTCAITTAIPCTSNDDCPLTCWQGGADCEDAGDCLGSFCEGAPHDTCGSDTQCLSIGQGPTCIANFCDSCSNLYDINGTAGNNRQGQNSCFFLGANGIAPTAIPVLGFAEPADDDIDNDSDGTVDEYVTANGPMRNMDIFAFNGPDMRYDVLSDIYGEAGDTFQAAVGILNFEKPASTDPDPAAGFGISVDDMVMEWREFYLDDDNTTCASGGECAVIDMQTSNFFAGSSRMEIFVLEKSPPTSNDCDFDDLPDGTTDCDSDGTNDLPVKATSDAEVEGEIIFANHAGGYLYLAELPISSQYDSDPGVLFVQPFGGEQPTVCVVYNDEDDGTGQVCRNDANPANQGRLESCTTLYFTSGDVTVLTSTLTDNRDNDGWADSNETVDMEIMVANNSGIDISNLTARLTTNDPKIDCIINTQIDIGDMESGEIRLSGEAFTFRVADIDRTGAGLTSLDDYSAELRIVMSADEFDTVLTPQTILIDLDLDAIGGGGPTIFTETFENGDFGSFTSMNLDAGRNNHAGSDGWRCQYSDPDWMYSNSYQQISDCYLAGSPTQADAYFWQIDSTVAGADARAYDDGHSAYMGVYDASNQWWTTPLSNLEAFGSEEPINIGFAAVCSETRTILCPNGDSDCPGLETCTGAAPELSFKHQVSFMDWRHSSADFNTSGDCGVVAVQLADTDSDGTPIGDWIKIEAYYNDYNGTRYDFWTNCQFDPTDDGNTEDDFFDPDDPYRRLGPSSTCFPEFNFSNAGDTDADYAPGNINSAREPNSGLQGVTGTGTWIESRFNLGRFRGRRLRLRFLNTALKVSPGETWEEVAGWNPGPWDDGWWIDDIQVKDALTDFATITNDDKDNSSLPGCGDTCNTVTASFTTDPPGPLAAPGQVVEINASASSANRCVDGTLQFQFWIDGDDNGSGGDPADTLLQGWTDDSTIIHAPETTVTYAVDVRCSSYHTCSATTSAPTTVTCPSTNSRPLGFWNDTIYVFPGYCAADPETYCSSDLDCPGSCTIPYDGTIYISWLSKATRRKTGTVRLDDGGKSKAFETYTFWKNQYIKGFSDSTMPSAGSAYWYILSPDGPECNARGSWQNSAGSEPGRDENLP